MTSNVLVWHRRTARLPADDRRRHTVVLCRNGDIEAAIEVERIWDDLTSGLPWFTVCSYPVDCFERVGTELFGRVCAAHSAVAHTPDTL